MLPDQAGNAVIAGHVKPARRLAIHLHPPELLAHCENIQVVTVGGQTLALVVPSKGTSLIAPQGGADAAPGRIFGPSPTPDLNLLARWGAWTGSDFNRRLVIHATLIGPSPFSANQGSPSTDGRGDAEAGHATDGARRGGVGVVEGGGEYAQQLGA